MDDREQSVQHFLDLIKRSQRGKFKVYIGMIAGVGSRLMDVSGRKGCYKDFLSFRDVKSSIRERNWKKWI